MLYIKLFLLLKDFPIPAITLTSCRFPFASYSVGTNSLETSVVSPNLLSSLKNKSYPAPNLAIVGSGVLDVELPL